jgi:Leucine-rich repeat (LRR) protein
MTAIGQSRTASRLSLTRPAEAPQERGRPRAPLDFKQLVQRSLSAPRAPKPNPQALKTRTVVRQVSSAVPVPIAGGSRKPTIRPSIRGVFSDTESSPPVPSVVKRKVYFPNQSDVELEVEEKTNSAQPVPPPSPISPPIVKSETPLQISYFLKHRMKQIAPQFAWTKLEHLKPYARSIVEFLKTELQDRHIQFEVLEKSPETWIKACEMLEKHDEPTLSKLMDRILPDLQEYIQKLEPSPWEVLSLLQSNKAAARSITSLDFKELELEDFPLCFKGLCFPRVTYINCAKNRFSSIPHLLLTMTPNVWTLCFRGNQITEYPEQIFMHIPSLFRLDLASNLITQIPSKLGLEAEDRFSPYANIDLTNNKITALPASFKKYSMQIEILLYGNIVRQETVSNQSLEGITLKWSKPGTM